MSRRKSDDDGIGMEDVQQFIRDFRSVPYWAKQIRKYHLILEDLEHQKIWGIKPGDSIPGRSSHKGRRTPWDLWDEIDRIKKKRDMLQSRILEMEEAAELISRKDLAIMLQLYWYHKSPYAVADRYGYSKSGLYKHINGEIKTALISIAMQKE